jgi:hypothetical protein
MNPQHHSAKFRDERLIRWRGGYEPFTRNSRLIHWWIWSAIGRER